ncbi:hypothetical protein TorRG33x02_332200 [Trema orientale]|uniref:Uncharacterized protein n=1 Tax=Trema orientale TaxID=63057 RepID=A0A2P5B5D1_TREOI|nr:hypothetical protein TorRG33x02_332200 [Trema orientale]
MRTLNMFHKRDGILTAIGADINCHFLHPGSFVSTPFTDFLHMIQKSCNRRKLCTTLWENLQLAIVASAATALCDTILCDLPFLANFIAQLCHACFSRGSNT